MSGDGERSEDELARTATAPGSSSAPARPADQLGDVLGRYRLERELGAGGMGVVHAAFDPDLERRVALKVLRHAGSAEARQRLLREARALARVTHPNVVIVHEVGSANGRDYVAMELIEGETLADWLKAAPRTTREIVAAFTAAGRGLAAAHAAGLVHRDFKPHNVLRRKDGRIVVTDFGLARGIEAAIELETTLRMSEAAATASATPSPLSELTETGSVLGTPAYMAPEQWSGDSVGPAADQFAFCVALWEALAGERPFRGATPEALQAAVRRGPAELDDSKVPRRLRAALKRGLDPDPKRRWPSMDALIAALGRAERSRGIWLALAGGVLAASSAAYFLSGEEPSPLAAKPACEAPVLDPSTVWTPAIANDLRVKTSPAVMRRFDALFAGWQAARDVACGLDTPMRARRLACLDGVIARLDAVRKASVYRHAPTLDQVSKMLVDPGVCNVDEPPRLPARLSDAAVPAFALSIPPTPADPKLDADVAAQAAEAARNDPCARAYVQIARVYLDDNTTAEAVEEALQLADSCGDDRARADVLLASVALRLSPFLDPKLQRTLAAAESAVRKVAQPDLVAHLDLVKATIAGIRGKFDEQLQLAESSIRGFGELRPLARLEAVETKVRALHGRRQAGDLAAVRAELAHWRRELERLDRPRMVATFDALDIAAQWELGDIAGAAARYPDLYERWEKHRKKPLVGATISGTVVDAQGTPVAGATVVAGKLIVADSMSVEYMVTHDGVRRATTDADGTYRLDHVEPGSLIIAEHGALRSRVRDAKDKDRLVLEPTTRVSGRVIDPEPQRLTVFALPADRSPMYQMTAPIGADGTFTIDRVPIGRLRVGAAQSTAAGTQSFASQDITVGPNGKSGLEIRRARGRKLRVIVRSSVNVPLTGAQVFVISGSVSIKAVKEFETVLRSSGLAIEVARPLTGETPPELGRLVPGDLVATFANAPSGAATACALGLTGDFADQSFRENLEKNFEKVEIRCVPVAADAKVATVEVPPLKRID